MAKKKEAIKKNKFRFMNFSNSARELNVDTGIISRAVKAGTIPGGEKQVYIKNEEDGKEVFHEVGKSTIKVVDLAKIELEKTTIVKFRHKSKE